MTVERLKEYLNMFDDNAEVFYFDSESGEDNPLRIDWMTIKDKESERGRRLNYP